MTKCKECGVDLTGGPGWKDKDKEIYICQLPTTEAVGLSRRRCIMLQAPDTDLVMDKGPCVDRQVSPRNLGRKSIGLRMLCARPESDVPISL